MALRLIFALIFFQSFIAPVAANWKPSKLPSGGIVTCLVSSGELIVAGCHGNEGGVFVSENGGENWKRIAITNKPAYTADYLLVDHIVQKGSENVFYVSAGIGVYKLFKDEKDWQLLRISYDFTPYFVSDLTYHDGNLYICLWGNGIKRSNNEGQSWTTMNNGLGDLNAAALNHAGDTIYVGTEHGMYYSTDRGNNWTEFSDILSERYIWRILVDDKHVCAVEFREGAFVFGKDGALMTRDEPVDPYQRATMPIALIEGYLYGNYQYNGMHHSSVEKISWTKTPGDFKVSNTRVLIKNGDDYILGTNGGSCVMKSEDQMATWTIINNGIRGYKVCTIATDQNKVFMVTNVAGVFVSADYGFSWEILKSQPGGSDYSDMLVKDGVIYLAGYGLFISSDNGESWKKVDDRYFTCLAANEQTVFAGSGYLGLIASSDRGASWHEIDFPYQDNYLHSMDADDSVVVVGTHYKGLYISKDYGQTWETTNNLQGLSVRSVAIRGKTIFITSGCGQAVCSLNGGVLRSMDFGESWTNKNYGFIYEMDKVLIKNNIVYGFFFDQIVFSRDNATTWERFSGDIIQVGGRISADAQFGNIYNLNVSDAYLYASTSEGVYLHENSIETVLGLENTDIPDLLGELEFAPNPTSQRTNCSFTLQQYEPVVEIVIIDSKGRIVQNSVLENMKPGKHLIQLETTGLAPGIFLCKISTLQQSNSKKLIVLK